MATKEEIQKQNIEEANIALGEQLSLVSQINDSMSFLVKSMREKGTLDKLSATAVNDVVKATKSLKSEYDSVKDVQKDIAKNEKLQNDLAKQKQGIIKAGGKELEKEVDLYNLQSNSLIKAQAKLAQMNSQKALGKKIDESLYKQAEATVTKKQEQLNISNNTLTAEAQQLLLIEQAEEANAGNVSHLVEQEKRQKNLEKAGGVWLKMERLLEKPLAN